MREEVAALPASFPATKKAVGISRFCCGPATGLFREVLTALYKNINPSASPVFTGLPQGFPGELGMIFSNSGFCKVLCFQIPAKVFSIVN